MDGLLTWHGKHAGVGAFYFARSDINADKISVQKRLTKEKEEMKAMNEATLSLSFSASPAKAVKEEALPGSGLGEGTAKKDHS